MRTQASLRNAPVAIAAAVALSLLALPSVQAAQQANPTAAARAHPKKQTQVHPSQQQSAGYVPHGCNNWPYVNMAPPCQSTWPAGDPNYHGSRPGPGP
jgi:hypothetical protein